MRKLLFFILSIYCCLSTTHAATPPAVVVTIPPIHALVSGVMATVAEPTLLLDQTVSPHAYVMRPSQMQLLQRADLVIWVGESLESFLQKSLQTLPATVQQLRLLSLADLKRLETRSGGVWETHAHHPHAHDDHSDALAESDHAPDNATNDPHIWLNPMNAIVIVQAVTEQLSTLDSANASTYQRNAQQLIQEIKELDQALKSQLAPVQDRPFIVFHDAYQYFEQYYQLTAKGAISITPEQRPSAKRLTSIRAQIENHAIQCVFREPQFQPSLVNVVIENTTAKQGILDPLGMDLTEKGADLYKALLQHLADNLVACLQ